MRGAVTKGYPSLPDKAVWMPPGPGISGGCYLKSEPMQFEHCLPQKKSGPTPKLRSPWPHMGPGATVGAKGTGIPSASD
jgi:hypothetical protein